MTPVLFCQEKSTYNSLPCDVFDINRNALTIDNNLPAIYHPPCRMWSRLRGLSNFYPGEKWLAVWSLMRIRRYGGILEHPAGSSLFHKHIARSTRPDKYGGFVISVNQSWFGHVARKKTYLYIVGCEMSQLPPIPLCFNAIEKKISTSKRSAPGSKKASKYHRNYTPLLFAQWLLAVIQIINQNKSLCQSKE
jgi:hypothetical protein